MASLEFEVEKNVFREFYGLNYPKLKAGENSFRALVTSLLSGNDSFPSPVVTSRVKDREECIKKFAEKYQTDLEAQQQPYEIKNHITDILGVRITCYYETDIPLISKILEDNFEVIEVTDKTSTLESRDDAFGYKGLHFDLKLSPQRYELPEYRQFQDLRFEIQIRTIIQHAWSELDHKIKYKKSPPPALKRKINRLAALFELADQEFVGIKIDTEKRERQVTDNDLTSQTKTEGDDLVRATQNLIEIIEKFSGKEDKFLDVFQFLAIARSKFQSYDFIPFKVDGFVQDIRRFAPNITQGQLLEALEKNFDIVHEYANYQAANHFKLNPYTIIRHTLYLWDKNIFAHILFDRQKEAFDRWLDSHKPETNGKSINASTKQRRSQN